MSSARAIVAIAGVIALAPVLPAYGAALTTSVVQALADTNHWNAPIWDPGPVSPTAGNTYEVLAGARVRSPNGTVASGGNGLAGQTFTFPGDALILSGELRLKQNFNDPIFNFPGVGGNAGLVFNGGILNDGEERIMTIAGLVESRTGTIGSINPGGQAVTDISANRGYIFTALLTGGGDFALDYGHDTTTPGVSVPAVRIDSANPTFRGNWIVNSGWLQGTAPNALGIGDVTLTSTQGPSTLDYDYDATNPTSTIELIGPTSTLILDQNLTFEKVIIDGASLAPGRYTFDQLNALFDANIVDGGNGTITIVPEPVGLGLLLLGSLPLLGARRRVSSGLR
jgi:hypothetical protein